MSTSHVNKPYMTNEHSARHTPTHSAHATFGRARCRRPQKLWRFWARPVCRRRARLECWGPRLLPPRCCRCCRCLPLLAAAAMLCCSSAVRGGCPWSAGCPWTVGVAGIGATSALCVIAKGIAKGVAATPWRIAGASAAGTPAAGTPATGCSGASAAGASAAGASAAVTPSRHIAAAAPPPPGCSVCALDSRAPLPAGAAGAAAGAAAAGCAI